MSSPTNVLITGSNRGIGKALATAYLAVPEATVIAAVRNPAFAEHLNDLPKAPGSKFIIIKIDLASPDSIKEGIESLKTQHNISRLDLMIANAGLIGPSPNLAEATKTDIEPYINVNVYGQLALFQATALLLRNSTGTPKFMYVSSLAGSLTHMSNLLPTVGYGSSKALGNYFVKWLSLETKDIVIWAHHPGIVETDTNSEQFRELKKQGIDLMPMVISMEQSAKALKHVIDGATFEKVHGKFLGPDGNEIAW